MPINLIDYTNSNEGEKGQEIDHLCEDEWEMPKQIETLEKWLKELNGKIKNGTYVADIGYSPRDGAAGGGAVLTTEAMEIMVEIGMELCLSEYPAFEDE